MPRVSILIPCYNAERWIREAIQSGLDQTWSDKEVIVVDDGSTDGSLSIIKSFGRAVRWESGPNHGGNAARNRLLQLSTGEWLQYLDADDYLLPHKIETQLTSIAEPQNVDVICGPTLFEYWHGDAPCPHVCATIPKPHDPWLLLAQWRLPQTGGALFRRSSLTAVDGWDPARKCCQEHDLYMRLLLDKRTFAFCETAEAVYRYWSTTTVSRKNTALLLSTKVGLLAQIESALKASDELSTARQNAINATRFGVARLWWQSDPAAAAAVVRQVMASDPSFRPAPHTMYSLAFRLLGFSSAETLAALRRKISLRS